MTKQENIKTKGKTLIKDLGKRLTKYTDRNLNTKHVNRKIFFLLRDPFIYVNAYAKISKNKGALTEGHQDEKTMQYFGKKEAEKMALEIGQGTYAFAPVKRTWIPKPGKKKKRPIDVPRQSDRIVQEAIRGMLEAIYEPVFKELGVSTGDLSNNYGFRPNLGCWSAIDKIEKHARHCNIVIEGDIVSAYNNVDHDILLNILRERITDQKFLDLIQQMLKSGVMDGETFEHTISGTPQGGIVSPLLFNIYMLGFDRYIYEKFILPILESNQDKKKRGKPNPEYRRLNTKFQKLLKEYRRLKLEEKEKKSIKAAKKAYKQARQTRNSKPFGIAETLPKGAVYARYADDWILAITCTASEAINIKKEISYFIQTHRKMQLDSDKTKITYLSDGFQFLGFDIRMVTTNKQKRVTTKRQDKFIRTLQRTQSRKFVITPDANRIIKRFKIQGMCDKNGNPMAYPKWISSSEYEIVTKYNQIMRGIFNYYEPCGRFYKLYRISYILQYSCARTIARRKKITLKKVFDIYGKQLTVKVARPNKPLLSVSFQSLPKLRKTLNKKSKKYLNIVPSRYDPFRIIDYWRTKIKVFVECCICGEQNNVSLYRGDLIRNQDKADKLRSALIKINRIQIPVCESCYHDILSDKYAAKEVTFYNEFIAEL
nr:hypothetical protein [Nitzschia ovalis]